MADLIFLNGFSPVEKETDLTRNQVGSDGDPNFINDSYKFTCAPVTFRGKT